MDVSTAMAGHRFDVHGLLGRGAMGQVYSATDTATGAPVAIKVPLAGAAGAAHLHREASALAAVNVSAVPVYVAHGPDYLAMGLVPGTTLAARLALGAPLAQAEALRIAVRVAVALAAAHATGWVHQDVKPGNILVRPDGRAVLVDFGIATRIGSPAACMSSPRFVGSPGYLAPEQLGAAPAADPRADVFALGCVLYECLTAKRAFPRRVDDIVNGLWSGPRHPSLELGALTEPVRSLVRDMTAVDPDARPDSALDVLERLLAIQARSVR